MLIPTKGVSGCENGWIQLIWSIAEGTRQPHQVYVTAVFPGHSKGPHLHKRRTSRFACVSGAVEIVTRERNGEYTSRLLTRHDELFVVPVGCACEIRCPEAANSRPAILVNLCYPAWSADDPDEWPVEDWNPPDGLDDPGDSGDPGDPEK